MRCFSVREGVANIGTRKRRPFGGNEDASNIVINYRYETLLLSCTKGVVVQKWMLVSPSTDQNKQSG